MKNWTSTHGIGFNVPSRILDLVGTTPVEEGGVVEDASYGNDTCPSFARWRNDDLDAEERVVLWVEHPDPDSRESSGPRFIVVWVHGNDIHNELYTTDNVEAAVAVFTTFRFPITRADGQRLPQLPGPRHGLGGGG